MSFSNASNFSIHNSQFFDVGGNQHIHNYGSSGLDILRRTAARGAAYNSRERYPPPSCYRGTRKEIIRAISTWISSDTTHPICWLRGLAGSGKSAIAQTTAEECANRRILAASFFFARGDADRGSANKFVGTIASQLAISVPSLRPAIEKAVCDDPSIIDRVMHDQFQDLIVHPLLSLPETSLRSGVVVIDALDECDDPRTAQNIITLLAHTLTQQKNIIRVILTSRPEFYIEAKFRLPDISAITFELDLHNFDARDDIRIFLKQRFRDILDDQWDVMNSVSRPWPAFIDFEKIVTESAGLFIFASTMTRFIDSIEDHPTDRLAVVLRQYDSVSIPSVASPYSALDELYTQVLGRASSDERTRLVLATVLLVFQPLSMQGLGTLLDLHARYVALSLRGFRSLLHISDDLSPEISNVPIRLLHISFRDFLLDCKRSGRYYVDPKQYHTELACLCLKLMMAALRRDICDIKSPSKMNRDIEDLNERLEQRVNGAVRYACCYWEDHLRVSFREGVLALLAAFSRKTLLHWIEVLSLMGDLRRALRMLRCAQEYLKGIPSSSSTLDLLSDAESLILRFFPAIEAAALHVYTSALPFSPSQARIRQVYAHEMGSSIHVLRTLDVHWNACLKTITYPNFVSVIALSSHGGILACGSRNGEVSILDAVSGSLINRAKLAKDTVHALTFSPECTMLAYGAGSTLARIGLLDVQSGIPIILKVEWWGTMQYACFSPDELLVAFFWLPMIKPYQTSNLSGGESVTHSGIISVWNVATHAEVNRFSGYSACVFVHSDIVLSKHSIRDGLQLFIATLPLQNTHQDNQVHGVHSFIEPRRIPKQFIDRGCLVVMAQAGIWIAYTDGDLLCIESIDADGNTLSRCVLSNSWNLSSLQISSFCISLTAALIINTSSMRAWELSSGQELDVPADFSVTHPISTATWKRVVLGRDLEHCKSLIRIWDLSSLILSLAGLRSHHRALSMSQPEEPQSYLQVSSMTVSSKHIIFHTSPLPHPDRNYDLKGSVLRIQEWDKEEQSMAINRSLASRFRRLQSISSDGTLFAGLTFSTRIEIWSTSKVAARPGLLSQISEAATSLDRLPTTTVYVFSENLQYLVTYDNGLGTKKLVLWCTVTGRQLRTLTCGGNPSSPYLVPPPQRRSYDTPAPRLHLKLDGAGDRKDKIHRVEISIVGVATSRDGTKIACLQVQRSVFPRNNWNNELRLQVWGSSSGKLLSIQDEETTEVTSSEGTFSFDGSMVMFSLTRDRVTIWDVIAAIYHALRGRFLFLSSNPTSHGFGSDNLSKHSVTTPGLEIYLHPKTHHLYHIEPDGWVVDGVDRVCWIPQHWLPDMYKKHQSSRGHKLAFISEQRGVLMQLDFGSFCQDCPYSANEEITL